jgi:hypothetical protein
MKRAIDIIKSYKPCNAAVKWLGKRTVEQMVNECERGDWLLWLAEKAGLDLQPLTLAKARCAKTVVHLMKDERSIKAVEVAERFGLGQATREELADAAYAAADVDFAAADAYTAYAAAYAAYAAVDAAYTAYAAADAAADAVDDARKENQMQTANICREVFGEWLINELNKI